MPPKEPSRWIRSPSLQHVPPQSSLLQSPVVRIENEIFPIRRVGTGPQQELLGLLCGYLPAHPLGEGKRKFWRFFENELSDWLAAKTNQQEAA